MTHLRLGRKKQIRRQSWSKTRARGAVRADDANDAGFTLTEVLVVTVNVGISASIALPTFFDQRQKPPDSKAKGIAHNIEVAVETCSSENSGQYAGCGIATVRKSNRPWTAVPICCRTDRSRQGYEITVEAEQTGHKIGIDRAMTDK